MAYSDLNLNVRPAAAFKGFAAAASLMATILKWRKVCRSRRELAGMTERDHRDLGYSSCDVDAEIAKPFWVP